MKPWRKRKPLCKSLFSITSIVLGLKRRYWAQNNNWVFSDILVSLHEQPRCPQDDGNQVIMGNGSMEAVVTWRNLDHVITTYPFGAYQFESYLNKNVVT